MKNKTLGTKILTMTGTILVWFPIAAPILLSAMFYVTDREFRFDYLMPAELFLSALLGGALLIWASLRVPSRWKLIGWGLGTAIGFLVASQGLAIVTGLASGATKPGGWEWTLVLAMLVGYILAVIAAGIGGGLLWRDLFKLSFFVGLGTLAIFATASAFSPATTLIFGDTFQDGNFDGWTIVDAPGASQGPSDWDVVQAKGSLVLRQNSNIYIDQDYQGTYVFAGESAWADYHLDVDIHPDDDDGVFVLFRYTDDDNYYRFLMDAQEHFRRLEKKVGGVYITLAEDLTNGYSQGRWNNVHISAIGETLIVSLDYTPIFTVTDPSLAAGMIGLGTSASTGAHFDNIVVATTSVDTYADAVVDANILTNGNSQADPILMLGRPRGYDDDTSLGGPGYWVILDMGENDEIVDGPGNDLRVHEVGEILGGVDENYDVYTSNAPTGPWIYLGQGIAVSEFDLAGSGLASARYIRIEDLSTKTGLPYPGSDIDAMQALNMAEELCLPAPTGVVWAAVGNDVRLSWLPVNDAVAYNVYASTSPGLSNFNLANANPVTVTEYIHPDAVSEDLFYAITSIGPDGCESRFSQQVPYRVVLPLVIRN